MELSKDEAYEILELQRGATFSKILQQYKILALDWFPDKHGRNQTSIKKFQLINLAVLTLCNSDEHFKRKLLTLEEMLQLFQFIFFRDGNKKKDLEDEDDDDDETASEEEDLEENKFEEFYINSESDEEFIDDLDDNSCSLCDEPCGEELLNHCESVKVVDRSVKNATELIEAEEREKKKVLKRRAQKKRRKEKKKAEKSATQETGTQKKVEEKTKIKVKVEVEVEKEKEKSSSSESEEDLDTESAFVATIAKRTNRAIPQKKEPEVKNKSPGEMEIHIQEDRVLRSRQLALRGNEMANLGHYQEAVELFSEAIKLNPKDHRFYGNRSYCYDRIGNSERALKDAEKSVNLAPELPKGHFRKGKALSSLKRYGESEQCFKEVLRLDSNCEDAVKELFIQQIRQIMEMGFSRDSAEVALRERGSVVDALDKLLPTTSGATAQNRDEDLFESDDEDEFFVPTQKSTAPTPTVAVDVKMDPKNPEGHNSIWVGNLQPGLTESTVLSLFSKYGEIISIKFTPEKYYAFINYKTKAAAGNAMRALQGLELLGANLLIRYPNTKPSASNVPQDPNKPKVFVAPINGEECYFWRTTGCIHGEACRFKHIKEHQGMDKRKMK